ncbi:MAG: RimK family alpha-L-glutamate ligase [Muribaculaceae bacterium]|nr:RimK family alpha-L-glutamate ligase [Muribaculaceae bacterium]
MTQGIVLFPYSTLQKDDNATGWWKEAAASVGLSIDIMAIEDYKPHIPAPDFAVMRGYDSMVSKSLEDGGVRVFSPWQAMECSLDKWRTYLCLKSHILPTPATMLPAPYPAAVAKLGSPFVVKQRDGSRGVNVFLCGNEPEYDAAIAACKGYAVLQKYVAESHGRDVRVWTIGTDCVGAVLRISNGALVSNYAQGGTCEAYPIDDNLRKLASQAAAAVGLDFAGIDVLPGNNGYTICEVNGNAGFRTLSLTSDIDILHSYFVYIKNELRGSSTHNQ